MNVDAILSVTVLRSTCNSHSSVNQNVLRHNANIFGPNLRLTQNSVLQEQDWLGQVF